MEYAFFYILNIVYRYTSRVKHSGDRELIMAGFYSSILYDSYSMFIAHIIAILLKNPKSLNLSTAVGFFIMLLILFLEVAFCYKKQYALEYLKKVEETQKKQKLGIYLFYLSYLVLGIIFYYLNNY